MLAKSPLTAIFSAGYPPFTRHNQNELTPAPYLDASVGPICSRLVIVLAFVKSSIFISRWSIRGRLIHFQILSWFRADDRPGRHFAEIREMHFTSRYSFRFLLSCSPEPYRSQSDLDCTQAYRSPPRCFKWNRTPRSCRTLGLATTITTIHRVETAPFKTLLTVTSRFQRTSMLI